ncbi:MAG: SRPBCC family protein [Caulobacterales bacterium]
MSARMAFFALVAALAASPALAWTPSPAQLAQLARGDVVAEVLADDGRSSGLVHGAADIAAPQEAVYRIITDCAGAHRIVAAIKSCKRVSGDEHKGWDVREGLLDYGFPLPRVHIAFRSEFQPPDLVRFKCLPTAEVTACEGEWRLETLPDGRTRVLYQCWTAVALPAPSFFVRAILRRDIGEAMHSLRQAATTAD